MKLVLPQVWPIIRIELRRNLTGTAIAFCIAMGKDLNSNWVVTVPFPEGPATKEDVPDIQCNPAADVGCRDLLSVGLSFFQTLTSLSRVVQ